MFILSRSVMLVSIVFFNINISCTRHAKIRNERIERKKSAIKTDDEILAGILGKQSKNMTFKEAARAKEYYSAQNDYEMVIKCGQRIVALGGDKDIATSQDTVRKTRLELARTFLDRNNFRDAEKYAKEYQQHYPGSAQAKEAHIIEIRANFRSRYSSDRDQAKTNAALKLCNEFLEKYPQEDANLNEIYAIIEQCHLALVRSELQIIETQLNAFARTGAKPTLDAAANRLSLLKDKHLPCVPQTKKRIDEMEQRIIKAGGKLPDAVTEPKISTDSKSTLRPLKTTSVDLTIPNRTWTDKLGSYFEEDNNAYFA